VRDLLYAFSLDDYSNASAIPGSEPALTPEVDISVAPGDPKAGKEYAKLYALWKADEDAYNQGRRKSDAEFLIWMATVRLYLTSEKAALFDRTSKDNSIEEFRAEKTAALVKILWDRHGFNVAKVNGGRCASGETQR
jgi:hypothetical protein